MSKPTACAEAGIEAAFAFNARAAVKKRDRDFMMNSGRLAKNLSRRTLEVGNRKRLEISEWAV